jgi:hypothetical protein
LGIGCQHFPHGILEFVSSGEALLYLFHPISGDTLDMSAALDHEGESPTLVTLFVRAMAARIPAAGVTPGQSPGQQIEWNGETAEQLKLPLSKASGLKASWFLFHIVAIILQVMSKHKPLIECADVKLLV